MQNLLELKSFIESLGGISFAVNRLWGVNLEKQDEEELKKIMKIVKLRMQTNSIKEIAKLTKTSKSTIEKWVYETNLPFIIRYLISAPKIKIKKNHQLLSLNYSRGGLPLGPWITVPNKINNYTDIQRISNQSNELVNKEELKKYNIKLDNISKLKPFMFAYLLGVLVGDASKHGIKRKNRKVRRFGLALTKRYKSNERFGNFVKLCSNCFGLRMNRIKDTKAGKKNVYPFYRWASQSSMLIEWIFTICLGLKHEELTTYHGVKMEWIFKMPKKFKIWFIQGLADSDGFVDITTKSAGIITGPNKEIVERLFLELGIKSRYSYLHYGSLSFVSIRLKDAYSLPIFNKHVKSYRYKLMEKIIKAKNFNKPFPKWLDKEINRYIKQGLSSTQIILKILEKYNTIISQSCIRKRKNKMEKHKITGLGIESTALE